MLAAGIAVLRMSSYAILVIIDDQKVLAAGIAVLRVDQYSILLGIAYWLLVVIAYRAWHDMLVGTTY